MTYDLTRQGLQIVLFLRCTTEEKHRLIAEAGVTLNREGRDGPPTGGGAAPDQDSQASYQRGLGVQDVKAHNVQHRRMNNCFTAPDNYDTI